MHRISSFSCTTLLFCVYSAIKTSHLPLKRFYLLACLKSNFQSQNLSIILPLLRSVRTISARSKLQKTGDLPLQERGIHSHVVTSSPSTARHSTELHSWHAGEQGCPFQDKDNQTKYSTCSKGISHKSLLHSWRAKHLLHILKTGRRPEHNNNYYILQDCWTSHKIPVSPNILSSSSQELNPEVSHCSFTVNSRYTSILKEAVRSANPYCQCLIDTRLGKRMREAGE